MCWQIILFIIIHILFILDEWKILYPFSSVLIKFFITLKTYWPINTKANGADNDVTQSSPFHWASTIITLSHMWIILRSDFLLKSLIFGYCIPEMFDFGKLAIHLFHVNLSKIWWSVLKIEVRNCFFVCNMAVKFIYASYSVEFKLRIPDWP